MKSLFRFLVLMTIVLTQLTVYGQLSVCSTDDSDVFYINTVDDATTYSWFSTAGVTITQLSVDTLVSVDWTSATIGNLEELSVVAQGPCGTDTARITVEIEDCGCNVNLSSATVSAVDPNSCSGSNGAIVVTDISFDDGNYILNYTYNGVPQDSSIVAISAGSFTIPNLSAGTYTNILITDPNPLIPNCFDDIDSTIVLTDPPIPSTPTPSYNPPLCEGDLLELTTSTVSGATYSWSGPGGFSSTQQNPTRSNVTVADAGTYSVTVTVSGCTSPAGSVLVSITATPPTPSASNTGPYCAGQSISLMATPIANATYSWSGPNGFTSGSRDTVILNAATTDAGVYTVIATVNGCESAIASTNVSVAPSPVISVSTFANPSTCSGSNGSITIDGLNGGNSYTLSVNGNLSSILPSGSTHTISGLSAGSYSITVSNNGGCVSNSVSVSLSDPGSPSTPTASNNGPLCEGETLMLQTDTVAGATYTWTGPGSFSSTFQNPVRANITTVDAGTYSVTVTVAGCTSAAATTNVQIHSTPATPTVTSPITNACPITTADLTTATISSPSGQFVYFTTNNPSGTPVSDPTQVGAGTYFVFDSASTGCFSSGASITVNIQPCNCVNNPTASAGSDSIVCAGDSYTLNGGFGGSANSITWTTSGSGTFSDPTLPNAVYTPSAADILSGSVSLTITTDDPDGTDPCVPASDVMELTIIDYEITSSSVSNPDECGGLGSIVLVGLPASNSFSITYQLDGNPVSPVSIGTDAFGNLLISDLSAGSYSHFVATHNITLCSSDTFFGPVVLTDPNAPSISGVTNPVNPTSCGGCEGSLTLVGLSSTVHYNVFYERDGFIFSQSNVLSTSNGNLVIDSLCAGSYDNISVVDASTNCQSLNVGGGPFVLTDPSSPTPTAGNVTTSDPNGCNFSDGYIQISGLNANTSYTITYSFNGVGQSPVTQLSTFQGSVTLGGLSAGSYNDIIITDNNTSCSVGPIAGGPFELEDPTSTTIGNVSITANPSSCGANNGEITLSGGGIQDNTSYTVHYTYNSVAQPPLAIFSNGSGEIIITGLSTGFYGNFTITDAAQCTSPVVVGPYEIVDPVAPEVNSVLAIDATNCGVCDGQLVIQLNPGALGTEPYNVYYLVDGVADSAIAITLNGSNQIILDELCAASYSSISITDDQECAGAQLAGPFIIDEPGQLNIGGFLSSTDPTLCNGSNGYIVLNGLQDLTPHEVFYTYNGLNQGPVGPYTTNEDGELQITGLAAGTYTNIIVTNPATGCATASLPGPFVLNDPTPPALTNADVTLTDPTGCGASDGSIMVDSLSPNDDYEIHYTYNGVPVAPFVVSANSSGTITIENLPAGSYNDISITNQITNCESIIVPGGPFVLSDPTPPAYTSGAVSTTDPLGCGASDGTITISGVSPNTVYGVLYTDNGVVVGPITIISSNTTNATLVINGLDAGVYENITLTDSSTNCTSPAISGPFELSDPSILTIGQVQITAIPSVCGACDAEITLSGGGIQASTSYTIDYTIQGLTQSVTLVSNADSTIVLSGLCDGSYENFTISDATNCTSPVLAGPYVISDPDGPQIVNNGIVPDDVSNCGVCDGSITIELDTNSLGTALYTVTLNIDGSPATFSGLTLSGVDSNALILSGLCSGLYSNIEIEDASGCVSQSVTGPFLIDEPGNLLFGGVSNQINPTACDLCNGVIVVAGLQPNTLYTIYYTDPNNIPSTQQVTSNPNGEASLVDLCEGDYYDIIVEDAATGCVSTEAPNEPFRLFDPLPPVLLAGDVFTFDPSECGTCDGRIEIRNQVPNTPYTVEYTVDNATSVILPLVSDADGTLELIGLCSGDYDDFRITNESTGCSSNELNAVFTLSDPAFDISDIIVAEHPGTCDGNDGEILILGLNPNTSYNVQYDYNGSPAPTVSLGSSGGGTISIVGLSEGLYSNFVVTHNAFGCVSNPFPGPIELVDPYTITSLQIVSLSNPTGCTDCDGTITLSGLEANEFYTVFYEVDNVPQSQSNVLSSNDSMLIIHNLCAGLYENISVVNTNTDCQSSFALGAPITLEVPVLDTLFASDVSTTNPTTCSGSNGQILIAGLDSNVLYQISYSFNGVVQSSVSQTSTSIGTVTLTNLIAGNYDDIIITNTSTDCSYPIVVGGPFVLSDPQVTTVGSVAISNHPSFCGACDGSILITGGDIQSNTQYEVTYTLGGVLQSITLFSNTNAELQLMGLCAGMYGNVSITGPDSCTSPVVVGPYELTDPDAAEVVSITPVDASNCGACDGELVIQLNSASTGTPLYNVYYQVNGIADSSLALPLNNSDQIVVGGLCAGNYTNISIHDNQSCVSVLMQGPYAIDDPATLDYDGISSIANPQTCGGCDGVITLSGLDSLSTYEVFYSFNGVNQGPLGPYTTDAFGNLDIADLCVGSYDDITIVSTATGCASIPLTGPFILTPPPPVQLNASNVSIVAITQCGGCDGQIVLSGLDSLTQYEVTYSINTIPISSPVFISTNGNGELVIQNLCAGQYDDIIVVNQVTGCSSLPVSGGPFILSDPVPPVYTATNVVTEDPTTCGGTEGSITLVGLPVSTNVTVSYTYNGVFTTYNNNTDINGDLTIPGLSAGVYDQIIITDNTTQCDSDPIIGPFELEDPTVLTIGAVVIESQPSSCGACDGVITLNGGGIQSNTLYEVNYSLQGVLQPTLYLTSDGSSQIVLNNLCAGTYSNISITDPLNCTSPSLPGPYVLNDPSAAVIVTAAIEVEDASNCGACDGQITIPFSAGNTGTGPYDVSYLYQGNSVVVSNMTLNGSNQLILSNLCAGQYDDITIIDHDSCTATPILTGPFIIEDTSILLSVSVINQINPTTCTGVCDGVIQIGGSGILPNTQYNVYYYFEGLPQPVYSVTSHASSGLIDIRDLCAGNYTNVIVENAATGCVSIELTGEPFRLDEPPGPILTSSDVQVIHPSSCGALDGQIVLSNLNPGFQYSVEYTFNGVQMNTGILTANNSGAIAIAGLGEGLVDGILVTDIATGCTGNFVPGGPYELIYPNFDIPSIAVTDPTSCTACDGILTFQGLLPNTDYAVAYDVDAVPQIPLALTTDAIGSGSINGLCAGDYTNIIATNVDDDCEGNPYPTLITLTNPPGPVLTGIIDTSGPQSCGGSDGAFTITGLTGGNSYTVFYTSNTGTQSISGLVAAAASGHLIVSGLPAGSYTDIYVIDESTDCASNIILGPVLLSDPTGFTVNAGADTLICYGQSYTLGNQPNVASGGGGVYTYSWTANVGSVTNPSTEHPVVTPAQTTIYTVTVVSNGCTLSDEVIITVNPELTADSGPDQFLCIGDSMVLGSGVNTVTGGTPPYNYLWTAIPSSQISNIDNPTLPNPTAYFTQDVQVVLSVTDSFGCITSSLTQIEIKTLPILSATINGHTDADTICLGEEILLQGFHSNVDATDLFWRIQSSSGTLIGDPIDTTNVLLTHDGVGSAFYPATSTEIYYLEGVFSSTGCRSYDSVLVVVEQAPVLNEEPCFAVPEDGTITLSILNDIYGNDNLSGIVGQGSMNDQLDIIVMDDVDHGILLIDEQNDIIQYTPYANYSGSDTVTYVVCNEDCPASGFSCDTSFICFTVTAENDPPIGINDINNTIVDVPAYGNVLTNDIDPDNDPLTTTLLTPPSGTLTAGLLPNGTYQYTPPPGYSGIDSFQYLLCDDGGLCDTATVYIEIIDYDVNGNNPPIANHDAITTYTDVSLVSNVLANDFDPDGDNLVLNIIPIVSPLGTITNFSLNGAFTYIPPPGYVGTDIFVYVVCDPFGLCDTASVSIEILPLGNPAINHTPNAVDDAGYTSLNETYTGSVSVNDSDPDGDNLVVTDWSLPTNGGSVTISPNGTYTYTPPLGYEGPDQFTYIICDDGNPVLCDTATVYITIIDNNHPPIAVDDINVTNTDIPVSGDVSTNDFDPDGDPLTFTLTSTPSGGTLVFNPDGTYTFIPPPGAEGTFTFTYVACDNNIPEACDTAEVVITVDDFSSYPSDNNNPIANNDNLVIVQDASVTINIMANDFDPDGDNLILNTSAITLPANGTITINPDGTISYTPNAGFLGDDSFTYVICDDGDPVLCDTATVNITVISGFGVSTNEPPYAVDDAYAGPDNQSLSGNVTDNDINPDNQSLTVTLADGPSNGTVTINPDGTFTYTPNTDYVGPDQFTYSLCDNGSPVLCDTATVYILIYNENIPPIGVNDINVTINIYPVSGDVSTNDFDPDGDPLTFTLLDDIPFGTGTLVFNSDGTYTYIPNPDFEGSITFTYIVCDNGNPVLCDTVTVEIEVLDYDPNTEENNPPVAVNDNIITVQDSTVSGNVLSNDFDPDGDPIVLTTTPVVDPSNGTVTINPDGTFTYTPNSGFVGTDFFVYIICDDQGLCDTAVVTILVLPDGIFVGDEPPIAVDDAYSTNQDVSISGDVTDNDINPDGDPLSVGIDTEPNHGTVILNPNGNFTYIPDEGYAGPDQFVYVLCDPSGYCDTATVYIIVLPDAVDANDDVIHIPSDDVIDIPVLDNDTYTTGEPTVDITIPPVNGSAVVNPDGTVSYTPGGELLPDSFAYVLCVNGICDSAWVYIESPISLVFPTGISPNGDGYNDLFVIEGLLDFYPQAAFKVYSRWGDEVWNSKGPYQNNWGGNNFDDVGLPDGTYFYILEYNHPRVKNTSGFVVVYRD